LPFDRTVGDDVGDRRSDIRFDSREYRGETLAWLLPSGPDLHCEFSNQHMPAIFSVNPPAVATQILAGFAVKPCG
jgi:hypothetical protein